MRAKVIKSTGSWYEIKDEVSGKVFRARARGKLKLKDHKLTNPIAVGDWVGYQTEDEEDLASITQIEPRKNYLIRKSVNLSKQHHIIASNIDVLGFVFSVKNPETSLGFLDRTLVTAEAYDIPVLILFNKIDLLPDAELPLLEELEDLYQSIGYATLHVSAETGDGMAELKAHIKDKHILFFGNSGAGKSSLANALQPGLQLKTGKISDVHLQGKHTTTFAQMFFWDFGGAVIDTPGVREFGLTDVSKEEISHYFPEIFKVSKNCGFHNCLHVMEPKCAVKDAVENGEIHISRYQNFLQILDSLEE